MQTILTLDDLIIPKYDSLIDDILEHNHVHYSLYGGRGSTKSSFIPIATLLIMTQSGNKNVHTIAFRKMTNTLRDSVYAQFLFAISLLGLDKDFKKTVSPMEITYKPTGQKILFRGLDDPGKVKSIKAPFGYFGITHFEELDQYNGRAEIRNVLQSTMRGKDGRFWNFESFNPPISVSNWANKDLLINRPDRLVIKTDYRDVPHDWLSDSFFDEAEFLRDTNEKAYRHEYLGEPVGTGLNVFENVTINTITDDEIMKFDWLYYGLDWGWYPHPNAFVEAYFNSNERKLYIFGEICCHKTKNEDMAIKLDRYRNVKITADPGAGGDKSIADFRSWGFNMRPAIKGPGSIEYGIKWLQSLNEIVIDNERCPNTAEQFLIYEYLKDKEGNPITGYPDEGDDFIDATRYALEEVWRRRGQ